MVEGAQTFKVQVFDMVKPLRFAVSKRVIEIHDYQVLSKVEAKEKDGLMVLTPAQKK